MKLAMVPKSKPITALQGQLRGFCTTKEAHRALKEHGLPEYAIYHLGNGSEDMAACLKSYRNRPGWLILAQDLRAFGAARIKATGWLPPALRTRLYSGPSVKKPVKNAAGPAKKKAR